jgi:hypothetical protein
MCGPLSPLSMPFCYALPLIPNESPDKKTVIGAVRS